MLAAAPTASISSRSPSSEASCTIAATGEPWSSTIVATRSEPGSGSSIGCPEALTYSSRAGIQ